MTDTAASGGMGKGRGVARGFAAPQRILTEDCRSNGLVLTPLAALRGGNLPASAADLLPGYLTGVHYTPFRSQTPTLHETRGRFIPNPIPGGQRWQRRTRMRRTTRTTRN